MGGTRLTIQFRICWIALGIDRFDAISGLIYFDCFSKPSEPVSFGSFGARRLPEEICAQDESMRCTVPGFAEGSYRLLCTALIVDG